MSWLKKLIQSKGGAQEIFNFSDTIAVNPPATSAVGKHSPNPGFVVVELFDKEGKIIAMDSFVVNGAPVVFHVDDIPATRVIVPLGSIQRMHQEIEIPASRLDRLGIPFQRPGAETAKLWWSCHDAQ